MRIVHECCSSQEDQTTMVNTKDVFLPDTKLTLRLSSDLHFDDTPWISKDGETHTCHPKIPYDEAKMLGVTSIRHHVLRSCRQQLPGNSFGQMENLVSRLKRILSSYPLEEGILKELVQNADDAGATKIHFIFDSRNLPDQKVFDDGWKRLQGPAFCVYNDVAFTEEDMKGIQNLGEGSKSNETSKIGQYGVGFNCVYHLTDVPTFVTYNQTHGKVLCALDPTLQYVPGATSNSPGYMFSIDGKFEQQFSDVFQGYMEKEYDPRNGTVFRFPLRQKESPISSNVIGIKSLKKLFSNPNVQSDMHEYFLFLNNIKEICFRIIEPTSKSVKTIFSINASVREADQHKLDCFKGRVKDTSVTNSSDHNSEVSDFKVTKHETICYEMMTKCSNDMTKTWLISQKLGFEDNLYSQLANNNESECLNLLPIGGVALLLNHHIKSIDRGNRKIFCFLPLPLFVDIPVHVNGHFALSHESRRNLWENDKGDFRTKWNLSLMKYVIAPAYCSLIVAMKDKMIEGEIDLNLGFYNALFPNVNKENGIYINALCRSVYKLLFDSNVPVLPMFADIKHSEVSWIWTGRRSI